jgi:hypothetical protein
VADNDQLLATMRRRFTYASTQEHDIREQARMDLEFVAGDQWTEAARTERDKYDKPCLTFNKLPTFVQQVCNAARQKKPSIKISPVDSKTDKDTATVLNGIVRHIEYSSDADVAYDTALEYAVTCGFGYYRILTEWCEDPEAWSQEIRISAIQDPFSVYLDPDSRKHDRSDMNWGFVIDRISRDEFRAQYGTENGRGWSLDNYVSGDEWIDGTSVQVAEYWWVEKKPRTVALIEAPVMDPYGMGTPAIDPNTGEAITEQSTVDANEVPEGARIVRKRTIEERKIRCIKTNGHEILEEKEWAGKWIPIVPVYGKEIFIQGKRYLFSLVRFARDPQQLYNFYRTSEAETVSMGAKAPWIGYEGQFKSESWKTANTRNWAYLEVSPIMVNGAPAPLPQRNTFEPPIQALSIGASQASEDIKGALGMFDAAIGAQSNETSGIAIQRRQAESDVSNFHFGDNQARAQRHAGRIIVDLIPKVMDTEQEIRIIGEDERERVVTVNAQYIDENGKPREYILSSGKYDVTVKSGPSYSTQRQEAFDLMTQFASAYPDLLKIAGDIVFQNSDIPGADALAERFKKTLPPELLQEEDEGAPKIPPAFAKKMQQGMQMIEMLTQEVNQLKDDAERKTPELELKRYEITERIQTEREGQRLKYNLELAKLGSQEAATELVNTLRVIEHRDNLAERAQDRAAAAASTQMQIEAKQQQQNSSGAADPGLAAAA